MLPLASLPVYNNVKVVEHKESRPKYMTALSFAGNVTKDLEPKRVWEIFEEITKIYRPSDDGPYGENCKEISNYLKEKLENSNFKVTQVLNEGPGKYNILAERNVKGKNALILQAHMDMVAVADGPTEADKDIKKPIKLHIEGDLLKANSRTLGADNGIGLAYAIAIAESDKYKNLPLQIIATVNEETGMYGAVAIKPEDIKGQYLINIDSEEYGEITIGCAGMNLFETTKNYDTKPVGSNDYKKITITIDKARSGHSGIDINKGRINPIRAILEELNDLSKDTNLRMISIEGGSKMNSIPIKAEAEILVPAADADRVGLKLAETLKSLKKQHKSSDPDLVTNLKTDSKNADPKTNVICEDFQEKLLRIMGNKLQVGCKSTYDDGNLKTSQNLGILKVKDGKIYTSILMRSSDKTEKADLESQTSKQLEELFGEKIVSDPSPIWEPKIKKGAGGKDTLDSKLAQLAIQAYKEMGIKNPPAQPCHGGLENAQFANKVENIDQISVGPDILEPHTVQEAIRIPTVQKFYDFLTKLIDKVAKELI